MLRRSARRSGQAPPDETPTVSPCKRGRGGGRGRGRGKGKTTADSVVGAADESNLDDSREEVQDAVESMDDPAAARSPIAAAEAVAAAEPAEPEAPPPEVATQKEAPAEEIGQKEESLNDDGRREGSRSRNEERMGEEREERRDEGRRGGRPDRWEDRNDEYGGRRRRSRSREEYDDDYSDRRRGGPRGPPGPPFRNHYGGPPPHNDGYGGGPPGPPPPGGGYGRPPWGYGRGRGRGGPPMPFRGGGGWRGRGDYGGPMGGGGPPHGHPGMMGPPPGWDKGGYDPMGGPPHPPPHMMHMRGPPPPHPSHYGLPPGIPPPLHGPPPPHLPPPSHHPHAVPPPPSMMGGGGGVGAPPSMVPPLPPGPPPPPPAQNNEMENVKTEAEMAEMKEQIARQIAQAREKAAEGREKEEKIEEKEEEKSQEDKEKRVKQASAMLRAAMFRKSTTTAATTKAAAAAAAAPTEPTTPSVSSTPQPVPPPPSLSIASSIGNSATPKASPVKKPETKDVFGKDDDGGLFGERKAHLSLPSAADRAEMQLYNDVLNAPHPGNQESPRKAPAPVPPPVSTPAIVVSKPDSDRRNDHSKERRSRSRSPMERSHRESRSPRRDRSPLDSKSPLRRDRSPRGSRSPRRSPKISPRRGDRGERNRRSRSRSHGRHRSSRSRSKERGGRTRNDSGHHSSSRRASSPSREPRSTRRRGYDLSPVRNSGGRSSHRSARRGESKSPRRERSKSRERRRSPERSRVTRSSIRREKEDQKERERKRSGGDERDEKRRKNERKDSDHRKDSVQESGDEGKENSSPGHNEEEIDRVMELEDPEKTSTVATDTVSIDEDKENGGVAIAPAAAGVAQLRPDPYKEITESIFLTEIKDHNDYGGVCVCEDGECGVPCLLRYLTVECDKKCPSGDRCTNRRMQQKKCAKVEVFHTGTEKGFGVRALEPIKKGGFIIEYLGEVMTHKMGEKRKKQYAREFPARRHHYLMTVTDSKNHPFIIDATKSGNPSRFLNHSCNPNAICDKWSVNRRFRMGFFAKKNIPAGEEITFDYRFQNYGRTLIECACGAPNCRRYLSSKDAAREEEERVKSGRDRSESSSSGDEDEEEEDEEEEEEEEISQEERKKLRKQQAILEEAERLIKKEKLTNKKQHELLSAVMIRLTPAHQELRTRLVRLLIASGEKDNEAYRAFLAKNGRTILEKYLTLGVDEDTTVSQYRELIPLLEALLDLLANIKQYLDAISGTGLMANLVPVLQGISNQSEVPDGLVVFEVMHDIVSGIEEEMTDEDEEGEWTKRWIRCTTRAAELADSWQVVYKFSTFKIPKKKGEKEKKESEVAAGKPSGSASMIRSTGVARTIKTESATAKGWQSNEKKEWRDRENYSKDRYASGDRGGYRKRKWDEDSVSTEKLEERFNAYRREQEKKREDKDEKRRENHSATNSSDSPSREEDEDMQISPNLDDERRGGEPEAKRVNMGVPSPLSSTRPSSDPPLSVSGPSSLHSTPHPLHHHQQRPHPHRPHDPPGLPPGPMPPPGSGQWGPGGPGAGQWGWHAAAGGGGGGQWGPQMGYGGYPNGMAPPPTHALSYFNLAPAPGSSLNAELVFWQGAVKYCQHKADDIQHRLDQASQLEQQQMGGQMGLLQHTKEAAEAPLPAAAAAPKEEKAPRPNLNDRLAALTGVQIKSGGGEGGGARTPPEGKKKPSPPPPQTRPPSRPTSEEIAAAKSVRTKDGRIILISSIAKYCKVRTEGAMYYYNKITRSPTWTLPDGEEANSEDEIEVGPCDSQSKSSVSGEAVSTESCGTSGAASSRSTTTSAKTPGRGRPQTPPEEPADPISTHELTEKEKLARKSEFKTRSGELLKRYVKASMFNDVEEFKKTLRKIIHGCIEKEQKMNPHFDFSYSDDVKHRMVEYTKKYVQRHKLKQISYPDGIAD